MNFLAVFLVVCVSMAVADVSHLNPDAAAPILKQTIDVGAGGTYQWAYETGNGIAAQEQGELKNPGTDGEAQNAQGSAQWTAPDGSNVQFSYVANENGYQPQGSHLPTPPPIPDYILRSIEYNKAHPEQIKP